MNTDHKKIVQLELEKAKIEIENGILKKKVSELLLKM